MSKRDEIDVRESSAEASPAPDRTSRLVAAIAQAPNQRVAAAAYRRIYNEGCGEPSDYIDWPTVNQALKRRWPNGLSRVKQMAWKNEQ